MTHTERTCSRCGNSFISGKLGELCPSCLFAKVLEKDETNDDGNGAPAFWEEKRPATTPGRNFSHFEILDELGRGGMGTVYKVRDHVTDRIVAVKILQAHHLFESDLLQRFRSEVRAISSLDHRHILPIHEVGEHNGVPFFSMKLAIGGSLAQHLGEYVGHPRRVAELLVKVTRGVQHAHERGILHRDLKPGNILLDETGEPFVCDFGLAKWMEDDRRLTLTSVVLGTPHYIAPEQASGKQNVTIAADIYSLGAILYELLTGRPPFVGETAFETLRQASQNSPAKPSTIVNGTPRDLETICLKALEREPGARYATAAALADDLDNWLAGRSIRARPIGAAEQLWRWARRNPLPASLGATLIFALVAFAISTTLSAKKIDRARVRAVAAEQDAKEKLYASLLAQAHASRLTNVAGHRIEALKAIKEAVTIRPSLELRNEAIAALSLVDIQEIRNLKTTELSDQITRFDASLETIALVKRNGNIDITKVADGTLLTTIPRAGFDIRSFLHTEQFVAVHTKDENLSIWEIATGKLRFKYPNHPAISQRGFVFSNCSFSYDGMLLATGSSEGIKIVELASDKEIARLDTPQPRHFAFDPAGKCLAFSNAEESTVKIWRYADHEPVKSLPLSAEPVCIAWSPDFKNLAVSCVDFSIKIIGTDNWQERESLIGHRTLPTKIIFSHNGELLASTAGDGTVRLWDTTGNISQLVRSSRSGIPDLSFSLDDRYLFATDLDSITTFEIVGSNKVYCAFPPAMAEEITYNTASLDYSPDSKILAAASTSSVRLFDAKRGRILSMLPIDPLTQTTLQFLSDGKTLAVLPRKAGLCLYRYSYDGGHFELNASEDKKGLFKGYNICSLQPYLTRLMCLIATNIPKDKNIIWNPATGEIVKAFDHLLTMHDMAISPDEKHIVTTYDSQTWTEAKVWSLDSDQPITSLKSGRGGYVSFSPRGQWLYWGASNYSNNNLWETKNWINRALLPPQVQNFASYFAFSPNEKLIAVSFKEFVTLLSLPTGKVLANFELNSRYSRLRFSPDGEQLAIQSTDNSIVLWNLPELRKQLRELNLDWEDEPIESRKTAAPAQ